MVSLVLLPGFIVFHADLPFRLATWSHLVFSSIESWFAQKRLSNPTLSNNGENVYGCGRWRCHKIIRSSQHLFWNVQVSKCLNDTRRTHLGSLQQLIQPADKRTAQLCIISINKDSFAILRLINNLYYKLWKFDSFINNERLQRCSCRIRSR